MEEGKRVTTERGSSGFRGEVELPAANNTERRGQMIAFMIDQLGDARGGVG
jgi:hypothetical protein